MPTAYIQLGASGSSPSICPARATGWPHYKRYKVDDDDDDNDDNNDDDDDDDDDIAFHDRE